MDAFYKSKLKLHIFNKKYFVHSINLNIFYGYLQIWHFWNMKKIKICYEKLFVYTLFISWKPDDLSSSTLFHNNCQGMTIIKEI